MKYFKCARCGACCRWPGVVRAREEELPAIALHLGISVKKLIDDYTTLAPDRSCLVFKDREDGACIFLEGDNLCTINPVKPSQCRTFPYDWNVPADYRKMCKGHWEERQENSSAIRLIHVLGHPNLPLDVAGAPADAQVFNCYNFCMMLSFLGIPYIYYGVPGSRVSSGGEFVSTGKPTAKRWVYGGGWHRTYNSRLSRQLANNILAETEGAQLIASLYGAAQSDIDVHGLPVIEPMVGYDHCWAPYRIFPSYAQQNIIYAKQRERTWETRFFDTVIPHFLIPDDYHLSSTPGDYLLYLGRDAPDKGIELARQCAQDTGFPLRIEHTGWSGAAKNNLIANARAVLMPTLYEEPFGYVAIEAQMCGTPAITTDWGAFPETVIHGLTGFRCRTAAEFAAAAKMASSLNRPQIRESALRRFSLATNAPFFERYFRFVWKIHKNGGYYTADAFRDDTIWTTGMR